MFSGVSPTGGRVRTSVAWVASVEETKRMKPIDQAIFGMMSESPGRNASEPTYGLDKIKRPSPLWSGEGSMDRLWADRDSLPLRRGG